ncbi:hemolysin-III related-domain-containing protein [Triangularia setosa]|uniref:Hemolysin-III related-domain-containing protein n=1 Tax=Triangularia setosa TaxID=2587417 RepID=A0AAN7A4W9_9PEZI|nr:hemolysin-III related-domain-containing protein [Podospora setosa]
MPGPAEKDPDPTTTTTNPNSGAGLRKRRPSLTESIVQTATDLEQKLELLLFNQLEPWRRDNPAILRGYRPTSYSFRASFQSLFYLHNESVNIWSHLLGAFISVVLSTYLYHLIHPRFETASSADILVFSCFFAGAFLCLGMSATYHAISNHSDRVAKWGNKLDYTGIVFLIVGSYVPALWYGFWCEAAKLTVYLGAICLLGSGCIMVSWFDHFRTPAWRPYRALMFVCLGLSGVLPIIHALITLYTYDELNRRMGLNWVILQGALYIFGAFLYAARFPERRFPGKFDIFGSSHQLFHICVLLAAASHLYGMTKAFDFHHSTGAGALCAS